MLVPVVLTLLLGLMFSVHELLTSTQPVRHVVQRYGSSYRGYWPSSKGIRGRPIPYESGLARDFLRLCEFLPDVVQIVAEPWRLTYELDEITYKYTPDYLLRMRDESVVVVEVKYNKEATLLHNQQRFPAIREALSQAQAKFVVATDRELRAPVLRANIALLEAHRHLELTQQTKGVISLWFGQPDVLFSVLVARVGDRHQVVAAIAQGILMCDITQPINQALLRRA